ncbi:TrkA C-terminal domain-containing protein [Paenibacillus physcomitrellae]|uniref:GntR family transcriptional regulator n=1 Tax=Paenibacillus physcomitrellae TaxID=1619311 RepID=A0ABQ1FX42_9BACL|nr:TrkA C-terminal domain-containing protein [Paenibacillus physcomitrellae]GGA33064.1 GntR family transcriptional regulator [Paenibacillus physcomitrellae]
MQEKAGYKTIALDIAGRIVRGEFPLNSKISGRSLLASHYHVSPETIRKAVALLKDENIVSVSQGKEIIVLSDQKALEYTIRNNQLKTAHSLKRDLQQLLEEKQQMDRKFEELVHQIMEASDRLQNLKPYQPVEIKIQEHSHVVGKTIGNLQFWQNTGATIIALRRGTEITISPGPHVVLRENDIIIAVGDDKMNERTELFINKKEPNH